MKQTLRPFMPLPRTQLQSKTLLLHFLVSAFVLHSVFPSPFGEAADNAKGWG